MRGLSIIVEGRKNPLYVKTRKEKGEILVQVIDDHKVVCLLRLTEETPLVIVRDERVVVIYE